MASLSSLGGHQANSKLKDFLAQRWALQSSSRQEEDFSKLEGYSVTDLAMESINSRATPLKLLMDQKCLVGRSNLKPPSLASLAIHGIIHELGSSQKGLLQKSFHMCFQSLPPELLLRLLEEPQLPYLMFRKWLAALQEYAKDIATVVDIDEMIIKHQRYLRSCFKPDDTFLVTLDDLKYCSGFEPAHATMDDELLTFIRQDPPRGGLELLDSQRTPRLQISRSTKTVATNFDRLTSGCLQGMDWSNVLVVGSLILKSLFPQPPQAEVSNDEESDASFIVIHLWGLNPSDCLKKVEKIYDVWLTNVSVPDTTPECIKMSGRIIFLSRNLGKSVEIRLQLFESRLHALLCLRPDVYGIGFDGKEIYMIPGCARGLETGYYSLSSSTLFYEPWTKFGSQSTFTDSVFDCEKMGFGMRILPSYATSLSSRGIEISGRIGGGNPEVTYGRSVDGECGLDTVERIVQERLVVYTDWDVDPLYSGYRVHSQLWGALRHFICDRVNIPYQERGWKDYVTRRIRWEQQGINLAAILDKQLVVPVFLPYDLEQQIQQIVDSVRQESQINIPDFLIPIHEPGKGRGVIPDYVETTDPRLGNVKYWVRSNEMLWGGVDPRIDEIFNLLDALMWSFLFCAESPGQSEYRTDSERFKKKLGAKLCVKLPPDLLDCYPARGADVNLVFRTGADESLYPHSSITAKEAVKFRFWMFGKGTVDNSEEHVDGMDG